MQQRGFGAALTLTSSVHRTRPAMTGWSGVVEGDPGGADDQPLQIFRQSGRQAGCAAALFRVLPDLPRQAAPGMPDPARPWKVRQQLRRKCPGSGCVPGGARPGCAGRPFTEGGPGFPGRPVPGPAGRCRAGCSVHGWASRSKESALPPRLK